MQRVLRFQRSISPPHRCTSLVLPYLLPHHSVRSFSRIASAPFHHQSQQQQQQHQRDQQAPSPPSVKIKALDHIVLTVGSIARTLQFYSSHLGMTSQTFTSAANPSEKRHSLVFGAQKINLHLRGHEFEPKARTPVPGSADLCLLTEMPVEEARRALEASGVEVLRLGEEGENEDGIVERVGARGSLRSFYCRDPDGNLIE
ncbi:MAG: hypothetical protein M1819_004512 [Sarea resinae]|nr:MAG: hypothetical protein M1819_004512 [Sarea resinae]